MPSKIVDVGRTLIATKLVAEETVDITRVKFGAPAFVVPIDNAPVTDQGGGVVGIPATEHGIPTGASITIAGTTNYDGAHTVLGSSTADRIDITATFVPETPAGATASVDPNTPPTPTGAETDVASLVHTVNGGITAGFINPDQVAYTAFLDSSVGDFDITQVGFFHVEGQSETLVMLANVPPVRKTGGASNNYKHTETLSIQEAAEATGVSIPAATWQLDHTARFRTVEDEVKFDVARLLGRFAALDGALLVSAIAPVLREDAEALTGWAASSGTVALDGVNKTEGANSVKISGQAVDAILTKTLGAAQDWSAANGALFDVLASSGTAIAFFIEDSLGNRSFWNLTSQTTFTEHEADFGAPDGNNGTDADLTDVVKFGLEGLDAATVYNIDNIRTARLNDFALAAGDAILEGVSRTYPATTHAAHLDDWNGDLSAPTVLSPPGAGTRNDKVWLDIWIEGNGSTVVVRAKLTVSDAGQADYVDGGGIQHYVEEIAAILRTTSERITTTMITDSRRQIVVTTTGALQSRDEKGIANGYAPLGAQATIAPDHGAPPIGAIVAVAGTFSLADNGGAYDENGVFAGAAWKLCDGSQINDPASPFDGRYVPKLDDGRFLRGNTAGGGVGGQATKNPSTDFAAAGNYTPGGTVGNTTLSIAQIPAHTHTETLTFTGTAGPAITVSIVGSNEVRNTGSTGGGGSHNHGFIGTAVARSSYFLNSAVNVEPVYFDTKYYQRTK